MNAVNEGPSPSQPSCLLAVPELRLFQPQAEDILTDEDLLDLFRIVKQVLRKKPDSDKLAKLLFCVSYALGDHVKFYKPLHEDKILFRDDASGTLATSMVNAVRLPNNSSCCQSVTTTNSSVTTPTTSVVVGDPSSSTTSLGNLSIPDHKDTIQKWHDMTVPTTSAPSSQQQQQSPMTRLLAVPFLTNHPPSSPGSSTSSSSSSALSHVIQPQPLPLSLPLPQSPHHLPLSTTTTTTTTTTTPVGADVSITSNDTSTDPYTVRPYTNFRPLYPSTTSSSSPAIPIYSSFERSSSQNPNDQHLQRYPLPSTTMTDSISSSPTTSSSSPVVGLTDHHRTTSLPQSEVLMEPKQRGFYYQDGRIAREPVLLQRYAEQGILTQASLMRKRKRHSTDANVPYEMNQPPQPTKKPKIPHRHGEFEQRRDDIINRMRSITIQDLEQKAQRMPVDFALVIEQSPSPETTTSNPEDLTKDQAADLLEPSLRILTSHSNMKPHLDNGMNQNGIYYNSDYFRLYMAFEQFQKTFAYLFPNDVVKIPEDDLSGDGTTATPTPTINGGLERDKDRERNANMKAYRNWIEPLLTETNWAAFRRNIVVGERMMQLTKVVGQGVLLMTKELSGSKLHLTFTNNEWDEFITGLSSGRWDQTIKWDTPTTTTTTTVSRLVQELRQKFITKYWFHPDGSMVTSKVRKLLYRSTSLSTSTNGSTTTNGTAVTGSSSSFSTPTLSKPTPIHHHQQQQYQPSQNGIKEQSTDSTTSTDVPFHKVDMTLFGDMIR
ncbi:hypothetical protein BC941DRAFT_468547 [Chlamydoabsidia padenii]|nr:hypothetical protein BC941DRAFT_468547 [Chlamydoabsidia padenii]